MKQKTIGQNPLDNYVLDLQEKTQEKLKKNESSKKERITFHISAELINKIKNVVYWEPGLTLASFAEMALTKKLQEMEKGKKYPERKEHRLKGGRPLK